MAMACPLNANLAECRCSFEPTKSIIHVNTSTYYSHMGIIQINGTLYSAPLGCYGVHYVSDLLHKMDSGVVKLIHQPNPALFFIMQTHVNGMHEISFITVLKAMRHNKSIQSCLRRIQHAMRSFIIRKWESRSVAVHMSQHPRLGRESSLGYMCSDALQMVLQKCGVCTDQITRGNDAGSLGVISL